jgi:hypothetical protein
MPEYGCMNTTQNTQNHFVLTPYAPFKLKDHQ